ncbi:MAG: AraC family transcriptional regulator [Phycisphaerae bacterium]|nr:AraC family transcriptional regulator [Phycisphaerae bacterium]
MQHNEIIESRFKLCLEGNVLESKYFFFDTDPQKKQQFAIIFGGFEKCASDFEIKRRTYPYYVIEIPIRGSCILKIGKQEHTLTKNHLGGFAPGVSHHYKCDSRAPMEHIFIVFIGSQAKHLFEKSGLGTGGVLRLEKSGDILYLAECILKKGLEKTIHSHELCCSYLRTLLLEQGANLALSDTAGTASMNAYRRCRKYIDENFSTIFLPSDAAAECDINIRYMSRLFKKYANITPHAYIMRLKLNKAANLLLISSLVIKDIAEMVGFVDQYHFSRNFKKFHGLSPRHYRAAHL